MRIAILFLTPKIVRGAAWLSISLTSPDRETFMASGVADFFDVGAPLCVWLAIMIAGIWVVVKTTIVPNAAEVIIRI